MTDEPVDPPVLPDPAFINARVESLFGFADAWAGQIWPNDRFRYLAWLSDPAASQAKKDKINANVAWADGVWMEYLKRQAVVRAGGEADVDFSVCGAPPHDFLDVAMTP